MVYNHLTAHHQELTLTPDIQNSSLQLHREACSRHLERPLDLALCVLANYRRSCGHGFSEIEMSHGSLLSDGWGIPLIFATVWYPPSRPLVAIYLVLEYVSTTYFIWYFTTVDHDAVNAGAENYVVLFTQYMYKIPIERSPYVGV